MTDQEYARLFFALWPDAAVTQVLAQIQRDLNLQGARPIQGANLHLTLDFLGGQPTACIPELTALVDTLRFHGGRLVLDQIGYFRKPQVVWAGCSRVPNSLSSFANDLGMLLQENKFVQKTHDFVPHITLYRKVKKKPEIEVPIHIEWQVNSFYLVESKTFPTGAEYRVVAQWPKGQD